jgi:site-specific recombinase XerD
MEGERQSIGHMSTAELLEQLHTWLIIEVSQGDPSPNTMRSYLGSAKSYLLWCRAAGINPLKAKDIDLKRYRAQLVQKRHRPGTIATYLAGVKRLYEAIVDWGWRRDNPAAYLKARKDLTSRSDRIISKFIPDRDAFLDLYKIPDENTTKGKRDRVILRILCYTGIRVSELCALDMDDVQLGELPTLIVRAGKGRKRRYIPLGEVDANVIQDWLDEHKIINGADQGALIMSLDHRTRGSRLSTRGARYIVNKYFKIAGLKKPGRSCHALRHSNATWLLEAGVPMQAIADLLGHSSMDITAIYARIVDHRKYTPGDVLSKKIRELLTNYQAAPSYSASR